MKINRINVKKMQVFTCIFYFYVKVLSKLLHLLKIGYYKWYNLMRIILNNFFIKFRIMYICVIMR